MAAAAAAAPQEIEENGCQQAEHANDVARQAHEGHRGQVASAVQVKPACVHLYRMEQG